MAEDRPKHRFHFVDPKTTPLAPVRWRGRLPHLEKESGTYFVTFRLRDAVTTGRRRDAISSCDDEEALAAYSEPPLKSGSCVLQRAEIGAIVEGALLHFHGTRYEMHAWCVMPNHVHVVVTPFQRYTLRSVLHSWKSYTSNRVNRLLRRSGRLWEAEAFDHLVRSEQALQRFVVYTEENPVKAGLCGRAEDWPFSSARLRRD